MAQKRFYKRWWFWLIVILVVAGVSYTVYDSLREKAIPVQTGKISKGELVQTVSASGKVNPAVEVEISASIAGEIIKLYVREGDQVEKGQTLVLLDNRRYAATRDQAQAALAAAQANVRLSKAQLEMARRTFRRQKKLLEKNLTSQEAVESAQTQLKVAKASVEAGLDAVKQAKANLRLNQDELSKTIIRSPMSGVVTKLNKEKGEIAMGSQFTRDVIMVVSDPERIVATVEVDEADIVEIALGDTAKIEVDALPDKVFDGQVIEIAGSAKVSGFGTQEETVSFEVKLLLEGQTDLIRPGMSATADIITETRDEVLKAPIQCVTMRDPEMIKQLMESPDDEKPKGDAIQGDFSRMKELLFVIQENRATPFWIETGISSDTHIEVVSEEVAEGMEIVCGDFKTLNRVIKPNDLLEAATNMPPGTKKP